MRLGVNVDHVATVREARKERSPDPVPAALLCEEAGAEGITVHLREDRRHIQDRDVRLLRELVKTRLNLEMAATDDMIQVALSIRPDTATLVPERREELTTEGGLDVITSSEKITNAVKRLALGGIRPSLFIDPDLDQVKEAVRAGAKTIEIHTGRYAAAVSPEERRAELDRIADAASLGHKMGLEVAAGHGLDTVNIGGIAGISEITEVNIGHSIISRALFVGIRDAVREMIQAIRHHRRS